MSSTENSDEHRLYQKASTGIRPVARRRQVLALSGGGYRGLFTARLLEHMEVTFGGRIRDHFELCVGTSAGALISAALAQGIAAATILGDGRVALILDVDGLVARCRDRIADMEDLKPTGSGP